MPLIVTQINTHLQEELNAVLSTSKQTYKQKKERVNEINSTIQQMHKAHSFWGDDKPEPYQAHGETLIQSLAALVKKFPHAVITVDDVLKKGFKKLWAEHNIETKRTIWLGRHNSAGY